MFSAIDPAGTGTMGRMMLVAFFSLPVFSSPSVTRTVAGDILIPGTGAALHGHWAEASLWFALKTGTGVALWYAWSDYRDKRDFENRYEASWAADESFRAPLGERRISAQSARIMTDRAQLNMIFLIILEGVWYGWSAWRWGSYAREANTRPVLEWRTGPAGDPGLSMVLVQRF